MALALAALPGRTERAIDQYARKTGIARGPKLGGNRRPWPQSDQVDAAIRNAYLAGATGPGADAAAIRRLSDRLGRSRQWIRKRAEQLGIVVPRRKEPEWTAAEDAMLREHAARHIDVIARRLRTAGFRRTACAVACRLRVLASRPDGIDRSRPGICTAAEVAVCLGVNTSTVSKWIAAGLLGARKRKTERPDRSQDAIWDIRRAELRRFVSDNVALIDFRKADKFWLVDLLVNRDAV
jgi:hypothetical protein